MPFDLRTPDQKYRDKAEKQIELNLSQLRSSYIPVNYYSNTVNGEGKTFFPIEGEYFFADRDLKFIHCYTFGESGERIRKWVHNIAKIDRVHFITDGTG